MSVMLADQRENWQNSKNQQVMVDLDGVIFSWKKQQRLSINVKRLTVKSGERVFIHGPSGSGKTTLLGLIGGVIAPESGRVLVNGVELNRISASQRDQFRADHIGLIFQMFNLIPYLDIIDNIILPARFSKLRHKKALDHGHSLRGEALRLMDELHLDHSRLQRQNVSELSVGQQQRVAVARALFGSPELIIADEPTSALDPERRERFLQLLFDECRQNHATLVYVSHDPQSAKLFDRSICITEINQTN